MSKLESIFNTYASQNKVLTLHDFNRCLRSHGLRFKLLPEAFEDLLDRNKKYLFEALESKSGVVYLREESFEDMDDEDVDSEYEGGGVRPFSDLYDQSKLEDDYEDEDDYRRATSFSKQFGPGRYGDHGYAYYVCPECGESGSDEECQSCMSRLASSDYVENLPSEYPDDRDVIDDLDEYEDYDFEDDDTERYHDFDSDL